MTISYVTGDATDPEGEGQKIIAHIVNDEGKWGRGFVLALSRRWPEPEEFYRMWCEVPNHLSWVQGDGLPKLGNTQLVHIDEQIMVANMMAQHGVRHRPNAPRAVDYGALRHCLYKLGASATDVSVFSGQRPSIHMPRIGCGLGGGEWEAVEKIIQDTLISAHGLTVMVYDLPQ